MLPSGFAQTRRFGGWSSTKRKEYLERFGQQLSGINALSSEQLNDAELTTDSKQIEEPSEAADAEGVSKTEQKQCQSAATY